MISFNAKKALVVYCFGKFVLKMKLIFVFQNACCVFNSK